MNLDELLKPQKPNWTNLFARLFWLGLGLAFICWQWPDHATGIVGIWLSVVMLRRT